MAWRILVGLKDNVRDARGEQVKREIREHLGIALHSVRTVDVYTVDAQLGADEVAAAAAGPFIVAPNASITPAAVMALKPISDIFMRYSPWQWQIPSR